MGMTRKHHLITRAVMEAMAEQQISQNTLARKCGVGQSMISAAFLDKYELKEEKWRLICEALGLDYDAIVDVADEEPEQIPVEEPASSVSPQAEEPEQTEPAPVNQDMENLFMLAMYAEGRLAKDIESGMKVDPMKLWGILDALKKIKDRTLLPE